MTVLTTTHKKDIQTILESEQFDTTFYLANYPEVKHSGLDPLVHYVAFGYKEHKNPNATFNTEIYQRLFSKIIAKNENPFAHYLRNKTNTLFFEKGLLQNYSHDILTKCLKKLKNYALFDEEYYKTLHKTVQFSTISPTQHALLHGIGEGRDILSPHRMAQYYGNQCQKNLTYTPRPYTPQAPQPRSIGVFYHTEGNSFIQELAQTLATALQQSGLNAQTMTEKTPLARKPELCIFCAPHEFFFLDGSEEWKQEDIMARAIMFNTEQPHTLWFTRGLIYCLMAAGIMDLCVQSLPAFAQFGVPVFHFDPLPTPHKNTLTNTDKQTALFRTLPPAARHAAPPTTPLAKRVFDISFFGNISYKREKFFAKHASFFAAYNCFLYYRKTDGPLTTQGRYAILAHLPRYIAEHSKIFLNIHRDDNHFFEWHRMVLQGMAAGAVVVSEECFPHPLYKAGTHYLTETTRHMPNLIEWLLDTPEGQQEAEKVRQNCFKLFSNKTLIRSKKQDLASYISSVWAKQQ